MRFTRKRWLLTYFTLTSIGSWFCIPATTNAQTPPTNEKVLYLTFDDGPSERYTPKLLDVLRESKTPATFFVLGHRCEQFPAIVRRMEREGHELGNHGFTHTDPAKQAVTTMTRDIEMADSAIIRACGKKPVYYRPPYGSIKPDEIAYVHRLGHPIALWTVDSEDWKAESSRSIVERVEQEAHPGSIILFHDGISTSRYTVEAIPTIIKDYKAKGYIFRTLPV
ncbi:Peptidoglycan/xylan/chitin deacetylase, PgdA/CDA1 family [Alicyclobacillus hesperidum]|uniref:Peptidoglycan/xylan/chitin deacetylase, PgdA/CDA1 family n=1 Tax=Alicyclobacillus hesperidum TaxID=89784 RepID=A0A1H2SG27_9BACL|nr:polysaccharide deacetylase family protein [Alicyclobacillus hesperidum]SDW29959.1 Peptidoglycan/xylan/chitin deacetylase, PgdA/CDA1 family [Alicyclobacillus hesperidum]